MNIKQPPRPPGTCRACAVTRLCCDSLRAQGRQGRPCCENCDHFAEMTPAPGSG